MKQFFQSADDAFVIAEIGHNHQGSMEKCKGLFKAAKEAGASAVKLQKRNNKALYMKSLYNEPYNSENSYAPTYGAHRDFLEFSMEQFQELKAYAKELDIMFFSTAFDFQSVDFLEELDMPAYKIASGDLLNIPLQRKIAKLGKPIFLSTGGGTFEDIKRASDNILAINKDLCILHCTASYPANVEDMNLRVIPVLKERYPDLVIGLSDHENGIDATAIGYMLGARVFEKHFTLNRSWKGTDQSFSLEPEGMRKMIRNLKRIPVLLGSADKQLLESEKKPLGKMQKQLVAARELPAGHVITEQDIALKSPGGGLAPYYWDQVVGKTLIKGLAEEGLFSLDNLK